LVAFGALLIEGKFGFGLGVTGAFGCLIDDAQVAAHLLVANGDDLGC
jgi:hypothetical protein